MLIFKLHFSMNLHWDFQLLNVVEGPLIERGFDTSLLLLWWFLHLNFWKTNAKQRDSLHHKQIDYYLSNLALMSIAKVLEMGVIASLAVFSVSSSAPVIIVVSS
ncbi:hypothetical protein Dsin_015733 [Dipteronia sinensis]|uniref:Uncharacterized protein n=1 Tax=Dipteronia sinensis TaxID=43782 RepID=A0AAE0E520_9ROSI|nr:hypothetical protein Dsin_015733 [Dipteronia sinensis]